MDCAEEISAIKRELTPLLQDPDALAFDLLSGRLLIDAAASELTDAQVLSAVRRAGMKAAPVGAGAEESFTWWDRRGRLLTTTVSGLAIFTGLTVHAVISGSPALALGLTSDEAHAVPIPAVVCYLLAVASAIFFIIPGALRSIRRLQPDMNLLMSVAIAGAIIIGEYLEAGTVAFLFAISLLLESWSVGRARRAVQALLDLAPPQARLRDPESGEDRQVSPEEVKVGDIVIVHPGERLPLDGLVVAGTAAVDMSPVTGESLPVDSHPGLQVYAGTIAVDGMLEVRVTSSASDTVLARIVRRVADAGRRRARAERWVERFARIYTPAVFAAAILVALLPPLLGGDWRDWFYRSLVLLVIGCPCALVISTPVSVVAALAAAARHGVLIKGGDILELPSRLATVALDKTGTLTAGVLQVVEVVPLEGHTADEVVGLAAALESRSSHPIAEAITDAASSNGTEISAAADVRNLAGRGMIGTVNESAAWLGSHRLLEERDQEADDMHERLEELARGGRTVVVVGRDDHVCGFIALADQPRPEADESLSQLRSAGIDTIAMLTGDNHETADDLARTLALDQVHAELLPDDKVAVVEQLIASHGDDRRSGRNLVAFVGDGINDAPSLAAADLGIAMGDGGTDVAIETADVALLTDDLTRIPWLVRHSRRTISFIRTNITLALSIKAAFVLLTAVGYATLWAAIAADMGASLLVIANGLRLLRS
jgi:Cd2+/Zn2+-exporting ATPase